MINSTFSMLWLIDDEIPQGLSGALCAGNHFFWDISRYTYVPFVGLHLLNLNVWKMKTFTLSSCSTAVLHPADLNHIFKSTPILLCGQRERACVGAGCVFVNTHPVEGSYPHPARPGSPQRNCAWPEDTNLRSFKPAASDTYSFSVFKNLCSMFRHINMCVMSNIWPEMFHVLIFSDFSF